MLVAVVKELKQGEGRVACTPEKCGSQPMQDIK